jgi:hypothetical protein
MDRKVCLRDSVDDDVVVSSMPAAGRNSSMGKSAELFMINVFC